MAHHGVVSAGHYLASEAGAEMFALGGSAIDAGVAAGVVLGVVLFDRVNFAGVAPIALHHAASGATVTIDGLGVFPRRADVDFLRAQPDGLGPNGLFRAVTPAAPHAWLTALEAYGTLTASDILEPSWELARRGFAVSTGTAWFLEHALNHLSPWPVDTAFLPGGVVPRAGEIVERPELASVIKSMMDAEAKARRMGLDRREAIGAARDVFYRGWVAVEIGRFCEQHGAWLRADDLASYAVEVSAPLRATYCGMEVLACGTWCQGPVLLQALNVLSYFDLPAMEHNSAQYLHTIASALDLAFADREAFYGDPRFVDVPIEGLLSRQYAEARARLIDTEAAFSGMPPGGAPQSVRARGGVAQAGDSANPGQLDTSYVAAVDADGNVFSATPSDSIVWAPLIPSLGFSVSVRGLNSHVEPGHPAVMAPGKRPRLTPSPALVALEGRPFMAIGCPGGDAQPQGMLQVLLNLVHFGMNLQEAIEAPRIVSWNFPDSFAPHPYRRNRLDVEGRIQVATRESLTSLGYDVHGVGDWYPSASSVHAALVNPQTGVLLAGSDPRCEGQAVGVRSRASGRRRVS